MCMVSRISFFKFQVWFHDQRMHSNLICSETRVVQTEDSDLHCQTVRPSEPTLLYYVGTPQNWIQRYQSKGDWTHWGEYLNHFLTLRSAFARRPSIFVFIYCYPPSLTVSFTQATLFLSCCCCYYYPKYLLKDVPDHLPLLKELTVAECCQQKAEQKKFFSATDWRSLNLFESSRAFK